jgi:hypothetical protein
MKKYIIEDTIDLLDVNIGNFIPSQNLPLKLWNHQ